MNTLQKKSILGLLLPYVVLFVNILGYIFLKDIPWVATAIDDVYGIVIIFVAQMIFLAALPISRLPRSFTQMGWYIPMLIIACLIALPCMDHFFGKNGLSRRRTIRAG